MTLDDKYVYGHCFNPLCVEIFDITTQQMETRQVPCGKCHHCKMTRVNEWVTRMRLQSSTYKNTYFVTFTISDCAPYSVLKDHNACWSKVNTNHTVSFQPLTLHKPTVQKFLKRLRKNYDLPTLSYFFVGEYGSTYGRPHYHALLWSDEPITLDMLEDCWKLDGISFGMIDFHDLNANGTMLSELVNYSFKYCCKYVQKTDFDFSKIPTIEEHLHCNNRLQNVLQYETNLFKNGVSVVDALTELSASYVRTYEPFMLCSRAHSIGGRYFEANKRRFEKGDLRLLGVLDKDLVFPTYFMRKTKQIICPYFPVSIRDKKEGSCIVTKVCPKDTSSRLPSVETLLRELQNSTDNVQVLFYDNGTDVQNILQTVPDHRVTFGPYRDRSLLDYTIFDRQNKQFLLYNGSMFDCYKYNRKKKDYERVGAMSLDYVLERMDESFRALLKFVSPFYESRELKEQEFDAYVESDFRGDYGAYERYAKQLQVQLMSVVHRNQEKYNQTKTLF